MSKKKNIDEFLIVIPARYNSSRLPGKLLMKIGEETVLEKVINRCLKAVDRDQLIVATDDIKIKNFCKKIKIESIMTSKKCLTGTDRVFEVSKKIDKKFYINVQGDEILLKPKSILKVIEYMQKNKGVGVVNCYTKIKNYKEYNDLSIPKVIFNKNNDLLYMSRSRIPGNKKNKFLKAFKQVCVYGFRKKVLSQFGKIRNKSTFENIEDIEILRFLENNINVKMIKTSGSEISIDTKKDLFEARKLLKS